MSLEDGKLLSDIIKTGFPCELRVQRTLESLGWFVTGNAYYLDTDENKGREIDVTANKNCLDTESKPGVEVWSLLCIEVKKSEKPWVIFSSEEHPIDPVGWGLLHIARNLDARLLSREKIMELHPCQVTSRFGRAGYVAFSGSAESPRVFSAVVGAAKASRARKDKLLPYFEQHGDIVEIHFVTPIVVVEGPLYECYLEYDGSLQLKQVNRIPYVLNYISPTYNDGGYLVDIVNADALEEYARAHEAWISDVFEYIRTQVHS
ncbi:MAG: hypothetical protein JW882_02905 [Deltaproteobacteria bacterium]|nr:hypothetical protein [Deltaproteobacteria bacterium]